jgi:hypothetical protein
MLYFFHGKCVMVVTHGVVKEQQVPAREINRAIRARGAFLRDPDAHTSKPRR